MPIVKRIGRNASYRNDHVACLCAEAPFVLKNFNSVSCILYCRFELDSAFLLDALYFPSRGNYFFR